MSQTSNNKSLISIHAAALLFGGTGLFSKSIALNALDMTAIRSWIAVIILMTVLLLRKKALKLASIKHSLLMIVAGILLGLHWVTYFHSMQVSSVAVGMIALFTYPMITILIEPVFKGEKPKNADIYCGLVVLLGVFLIVPRFSLASETTLGVLWGVFSALLFSIRNVIQRHYLASYSGELSILYQGSVIGLMLVGFMHDFPSFDNTSIWIQLLVLGVVFTALPSCAESLVLQGEDE